MGKREYDPAKHCGAKARHGGPCTNWKGQGTDHVGIGHCKLHGGSTPNQRAAAQEEQARALAQTLGVPIEHDPKDGILQAIYWSWGHVTFYRAQVQALDPSALIWGLTSTKEGFEKGERVELTEHGAAVHVWLKLYGEERDRHAKLCIEAVKIGLDERRVRAVERQAQVFAQGLAWLQGEARLRLDLNEVEQRVFRDLLSEMLGRLDQQETSARG